MVDKPDKQVGAQKHGVIVGFDRGGIAVKVSAIDTLPFEEVSVITPLSSTEREMTGAVFGKLARVEAGKMEGAKRGATEPMMGLHASCFPIFAVGHG